jgi:hypothetical protein
MKASLLLVAILVFFSLQIQAQQAIDSLKTKIEKVYTTTRLTTEKPVIDGVLDDACWQNNNWAGDFIQWIPNEGAAPSFPTYINILYDSKNIYVAIRAVDYEPEKIIRKASRRDELSGDMVGINFDSYYDKRTGFEFNVSAAGQKTDLILTNPMNADMNWDAVWKVKVGMEDTAWIAEYEIPLSQLRYSSDAEQTWGLHVWRWLDRKQEESDWEPLTLTGPGMLYQFGKLKGIRDLPKSRRIELMPYMLGRVSTLEKNEANPYAGKGFRPFGSIGLDAKIGLSSNFTADVTINPDFGQVESDPSVMNLSAFETFYEEKRPFFLEGRNIFNFDFNGNNLFYSRRIGQSPTMMPAVNPGEFINYPQNTSIVEAAKISGKTANGLSVGILQSLTNVEKAAIGNGNSERHEVVQPMMNYSLLRVLKDYNQGTTMLGAIFTGTHRFLESYPQFENLPGNAYTGGIDFHHQWNDKEFFLDAKWVMSRVQGDAKAIGMLQQSSARFYQRPDAEHLQYDSLLTQLSGQGGSIKIGKGSKGNFRYSTGLQWRSPGLELNDLGYMQMADQVFNQNELSYFTNQPIGIIRSFSAGVSQNNYLDYAMNYQMAHFHGNFNLQFLNRWGVNMHFCHFPESVDTRLLRGGPAMKVPLKTHADLKVSSDGSKKASFSLYTFYETAGEESAETFTMAPTFTYHPFNTLKLSLRTELSVNRNELQYVGKAWNLPGEVILGNIVQQTLNITFRADYHLTPELSIQYYGSPFASSGDFTNLKLVNNPLANTLEERYHVLGAGNDNIPLLSEAWGVRNPEFTFSQFRSNLVFRWEYKPGSKLFLVWANERTMYQQTPSGSIVKAFNGLSQAFPTNVFLVKLNYWFSL